MRVEAIKVEWESDVRALMILRNSVREFMTGSQHEISWREQRIWWSNLNHDDVHIWIYLNGADNFVGYGQVRLERKYHTYAVTSHALIKSERGKGLGEVLLRDLIEKSKALGADRMRAEIFRSNEASLGLCKKLGYVETDRDVGEGIAEVILPL